jgi:hypothetical protein
MRQERYVTLDPMCPAVAVFMRTLTLFDDQTAPAAAAPPDDIIVAGWGHEHRSVCPRCQRFGAAGVEVR